MSLTRFRRDSQREYYITTRITICQYLFSIFFEFFQKSFSGRFLPPLLAAKRGRRFWPAARAYEEASPLPVFCNSWAISKYCTGTALMSHTPFTER